MSDIRRALALFQGGDLDGAERALRDTLRIYPGDGEAAHLLAGVLHARGDIAGALSQFAKAAALAPNDAALAFNYGRVLADAGRREEAAAAFARALSLSPGDAEAELALGLSLAALGRVEAALPHFEAARRLRPGDAAAHYNAGVALAALGRHREAVRAYDAALSVAPGHLDARANRGVAHAALLDMDLAIADLAAVAAQAPESAARVRQLALTLLEADRHDEAEAALVRVLAMEPDDADARYALGVARLARGDYAEGLPLYEERWRVRGGPRPRVRAAPVWTGSQEIAGRRVLIEGEQGIGDALMFCRFIPELAARGATPLVLERAALLGVLGGLGAPVSDQDAPAPPHDFVIPMASLPLALGARAESLPMPPYLTAEPARIAGWRARLGPARRRRIGIAWRGADGGDRQTRRRALPLESLERLLCADADFISLQLSAGEAAPALERARARSFGEDIRDFRDLAALIAALDLVISVDTAVAHLAGALHAPLWVLLARPCDWRWRREGASPWYPSARLFRQPAPGDWRSVVEAVHAALQM